MHPGVVCVSVQLRYDFPSRVKVSFGDNLVAMSQETNHFFGVHLERLSHSVRHL